MLDAESQPIAEHLGLVPADELEERVDKALEQNGLETSPTEDEFEADGRNLRSGGRTTYQSLQAVKRVEVREYQALNAEYTAGTEPVNRRARSPPRCWKKAVSAWSPCSI